MWKSVFCFQFWWIRTIQSKYNHSNQPSNLTINSATISPTILLQFLQSDCHDVSPAIREGRFLLSYVLMREEQSTLSGYQLQVRNVYSEQSRAVEVAGWPNSRHHKSSDCVNASVSDTPGLKLHPSSHALRQSYAAPCPRPAPCVEHHCNSSVVSSKL